MWPTTVPESAAAAAVSSAVAVSAICCCGLSGTPSTVNSTSGAPISMRSPGWACSAVMVPLTGEGTSTTALDVSTASIGASTSIRSPTCTCHRSTSASDKPSPRSGNLNTVMVVASIGQGSPDSVHDARYARDVIVLETIERHDGVVAGHAPDRPLEVIERLLRDDCRDFGAEPRGAHRLVHDQEPAGLGHRVENRIEVDGRQCPDIDYLALDALGGHLIGGLEAVDR